MANVSDIMLGVLSENDTELNLSNETLLVMNQTNIKNCRRLDIYLANNIAQSIIKNTGQQDVNFRFLGWLPNLTTDQCKHNSMGTSAGIETETKTSTYKHKGELCFHNTANISRSKLSVSYGLNAGVFRFVYKGCLGTCYVRTNTSQSIANTHITQDDYINKSIALEFDEPVNNYLAIEMVTQSSVYVDKYILECDDDVNTVKIFCNEEGYWEKLMSKRKRKLETIYLPTVDKKNIIDDITKFLLPETVNKYENIGRTHKRVYLFEGLPGTGKSSFILALASYFEYDVAIISFTEKVTDGTFMRLLNNLPPKTILVIEDIDVLFTDRKKNDEHKNMVTFSGILNNLDGLSTQDGFICFITTNYKNHLDSALIRPGRIDKQLQFANATAEQIYAMYERFMGDLYTSQLSKSFYDEYVQLGISTTISLIQEYLFQYIDDPTAAIHNLSKLKELYTQTTEKTAELYI